jgi:hypothetical protein
MRGSSLSICNGCQPQCCITSIWLTRSRLRVRDDWRTRSPDPSLAGWHGSSSFTWIIRDKIDRYCYTTERDSGRVCVGIYRPCVCNANGWLSVPASRLCWGRGEPSRAPESGLRAYGQRLTFLPNPVTGTDYEVLGLTSDVRHFFLISWMVMS